MAALRAKQEETYRDAVKKAADRTVTREQVVSVDDIEMLGVKYDWVICNGPYTNMCLESYTYRPSATNLDVFKPMKTEYQRSVDNNVMAVDLVLVPWVPAHWEHARMLVEDVAPALRRANVPSSMLLLFDFFTNPINDNVLAPTIKKYRELALNDEKAKMFHGQRCIIVVSKANANTLITRQDGLAVYDDSGTREQSVMKKLTRNARAFGQLPYWRFNSDLGAPMSSLKFEATATWKNTNGTRTLANWDATRLKENEYVSELWDRPKELLYKLQAKQPIAREEATFHVSTEKGAPLGGVRTNDDPEMAAMLLEPGYVVLSMLLREVITNQIRTSPPWRQAPMDVATAYTRAMKWLIGTQELHMRSAGYKLGGLIPVFPMGTASTVNGVWFLPHRTYTIAALHLRYRVATDAKTNVPLRELFASACPVGYNMAIGKTVMGMLSPQLSPSTYNLLTGPAVYPRCVRTLFHHLHLLGLDVKDYRNKSTVGVVLGTWQEAQKRLDTFRDKNSVMGAWRQRFSVVTGTGDTSTDAARAAATEEHRFRALIDYVAEVTIGTIEIMLMKAAGMSGNSAEQETTEMVKQSETVVASSLATIMSDVASEGGSLIANVAAAVSSITKTVSTFVSKNFSNVIAYAATAGVLGIRFVRFLLRHPLVSLKVLKFVGDFLGIACDICVTTFKSALGYDTGNLAVVRTRVPDQTVARKMSTALFGCSLVGPADGAVYEQLDIDTQKWVTLDAPAAAAHWAADESMASASTTLAWTGWQSMIEEATAGKDLYRSAQNLIEAGVTNTYASVIGTDTAKQIMLLFGSLAGNLQWAFSELMAVSGQVAGAVTSRLPAGPTAEEKSGLSTFYDYTVRPFVPPVYGKTLGLAANAVGSGLMSMVNLSAAAGLSLKRIVFEITKMAPEMLMDTFFTYLKTMRALEQGKAMWHLVSGPCLRSMRETALIDGRRAGECESKLPVAFELMMENAPYYALTMLALPNSLDYNLQPYEGQFQWMLRTSFALDKRPPPTVGTSGAATSAAEYMNSILATPSQVLRGEQPQEPLGAATQRKYWVFTWKDSTKKLREIELSAGNSLLSGLLYQVMGANRDSSDPTKQNYIFDSDRLKNAISYMVLGLGAIAGALVTFKLMAVAVTAVAAGGSTATAAVAYTFVHTVKYASKEISDGVATAALLAFKRVYPNEKVSVAEIKTMAGTAAIGGSIGALSSLAVLSLWDALCDAMGGCTTPRAFSLHHVLAFDTSGTRYNVFHSAVTKYYAMFKNKDPGQAKYGSWLDAGRDTASWSSDGKTRYTQKRVGKVLVRDDKGNPVVDKKGKPKEKWIYGGPQVAPPPRVRPRFIPTMFKQESDHDSFVQLNNWLLNIPGIPMYIPMDAKKNFDMDQTCAYFTGGFVRAPDGSGETYQPCRSFPILWTMFRDNYGDSDVFVADATAKPAVAFKAGASGPATTQETVLPSFLGRTLFGSTSYSVDIIKATPYQATADTPVWVSESRAIELSVTYDQVPGPPPLMNPTTSTVPVLDNILKAGPPFIGPLLETQPPLGNMVRPSAVWTGTTAVLAPPETPQLRAGGGGSLQPPIGTSAAEVDHATTEFVLPPVAAPPNNPSAARVAARQDAQNRIAANGRARVLPPPGVLTIPERGVGDPAYVAPAGSRDETVREARTSTALTVTEAQLEDVGGATDAGRASVRSDRPLVRQDSGGAGDPTSDAYYDNARNGAINFDPPRKTPTANVYEGAPTAAIALVPGEDAVTYDLPDNVNLRTAQTPPAVVTTAVARVPGAVVEDHTSGANVNTRRSATTRLTWLEPPPDRSPVPAPVPAALINQRNTTPLI